jgi:hypothetical protein|tara:strand:- start:2264 stop:3154 length:891 start_codon:yes stop_codon:yes gene_type:complete
MAREYGFTDKERQLYFAPEKVYSSFGRDDDDDFVALFVYSENDILLETIILEAEEVGLDSGENFIDLNVGKHLRDAGYVEGNFNVSYKFLRRLAGVEQKVFVDGQGNVYEGKVKTRTINGEERYFATNNSDDQDTAVELELFKRDLTYVIDDISPDRTEAIVEVDELIKNQEYKEDFQSMSEMLEYKPLRLNGAGPIKFDQTDPTILEFDINDLDRGFTQNMVGGQIVIPSLYQMENEIITNEDEIVREIVEVDFFEPEEVQDPTPEPEPEEEIIYDDQTVQDGRFDKKYDRRGER